MNKFAITAIVDGERLFYAGKHYEASGSFSRDIYHATLYTDRNDTTNMQQSLMDRFPTIGMFTVVLVKVHIQEVASK